MCITVARHANINIHQSLFYLQKDKDKYTLHAANKNEWVEARKKNTKDIIFNLGKITKILKKETSVGLTNSDIAIRINQACKKHNDSRKQWLKYFIIPWLFSKIFGWTCMTKYDQLIPSSVVYDPLYKKHLTGAAHPESPARLDAIMETLNKTSLKVLPPRIAVEKEILLCHTKEYYDLVKREVLEGRNELTTGDAIISADSFKVASLAAGGVLTAVDHVMSGKDKTIFCAVRPPGHHACSNKGMGFCLFNNVGIGARYAQKNYDIERVLIVDWDVHHGNGTQEIFYSDPSVFYFSTHELGNYPRTGEENETGTSKALGSTMNCPIKGGKDGNSRIEVLKAFTEKLIPAMETFKPQLVMISAGFDAHVKDPLGHFNLTDEDFAEMTRIVKQIADKHAKGRIVSVLEGGYNLDALSSAVLAHVKELT